MNSYFTILNPNTKYLICNHENKTIFIVEYKYTACYYGDILLGFIFNNNNVEIEAENSTVYTTNWIKAVTGACRWKLDMNI